MKRFPWRHIILLLAAIATSIVVRVGLPGVPPLPPLGSWPKVILILWIVWRLWRLLAAQPFEKARVSEETSS